VRAVAADFDLVSPGSLDGVLSLLADAPGTWTPIAGGTEVMVQFAAGRLRARRLVSIFGLPELTAIEISPEELTLGAGVTYTALRQHALLAAEFPLLARAASWTGSIANQNRGTLGGNIVNGSPAADSPPALLAYGAEVTLGSVRGRRRIPYDSFHTGYKRSQLALDELLLAVHLPRRFTEFHHYLRKVGPRAAQAISKVALGAVARLEDGVVREPSIGLASVSYAPFRCRRTELTLTGQTLTPALMAEAERVLLDEIAPLDDIRSTGRYRTRVAANLLGEFLQQLGEIESGWSPTPAPDPLAHLGQPAQL
jgi:CO/xanthine dehydrogenase FAD-binding subunit